jgi:hypothetical protein
VEPDEDDLDGDFDDEYDGDYEDEYDQFEGPGWHRGMSIDEERRAITELAMQQLAERPQGRVRPESMLGPDPDAAASAEAMRNQALSRFLDRQQQMAADRPTPAPREKVVQKVSGMTVSPNLTTRPTMTSSGLSPELEAQYGMRRLRVDPANKEREQASDGGADGGGGASAATDSETGGRKRPLRAPRDGDAAGGEGHAAERVGKRRAAGGAGAGGGGGGRDRSGSSPEATRASSEASRSPAGGGGSDRSAAGSGAGARGSSAALRGRPVQRRGGARAGGDGRWRALAELADLLAEEVFPGDALPELCRWLSGTVDATVAMVLLTDDAVDDVSAWPEDDPVASELAAAAGGPLAEGSTIWDAVSDGRSLTGGPDDALVLPDGEVAEDVGSWAVVPVVDRTVAFGAMVVIGSGPDGLPGTTVSLVEDVAQRVARALLNCEEAATSAPPVSGAGDGLPPAIRDRLAALSFVLEAIEAPPRPQLQGEQQRQYAEITAGAARLQAQVAGLLTGSGGARS